MRLTIQVRDADAKQVEKLRIRLIKAFQKLYSGDISVVIKRGAPMRTAQRSRR